jgi:hypothetical protein
MVSMNEKYIILVSINQNLKYNYTWSIVQNA